MAINNIGEDDGSDDNDDDGCDDNDDDDDCEYHRTSYLFTLYAIYIITNSRNNKSHTHIYVAIYIYVHK